MIFKKIAILTLHPHNYGGVLATQRFVYHFCQKYFEPTLFFLGFDPAISASIKRLKYRSQVRYTNYFGMQSVEIGSRWAFWEPGHYKNTIKQWEKELAGYEYFIVASGTPIAAHPLVLLNKRFIGNYATPCEADRTQRMGKTTGIRAFIEKRAHTKMLAIEKEILEKTTLVMPMSQYTKVQFDTLCEGLEQKTLVCGQPIADEKIGIVPITKKGKILLAVGRFDDPRKNIAMLLQVFDWLYTQVPDLILYIVGSRPSPEVLKPYESLKSFKAIVFTGYVEASVRDLLYEQADIMLITSYQEGLGIIGLEALARGIPVVSTDCGGSRDFVIEGKTGYLVAINDVEAMVLRVLTLLTNSTLYEAIRKYSPEFIKQEFSVTTIEEKYKQALITVYPELESYFAQGKVTTRGVQHIL